MTSRRKHSPTPPHKGVPSTRPPSRPIPPSNGPPPTRQRRTTRQPTKARTHIFAQVVFLWGKSRCLVVKASGGAPKDVAARRGRQDVRLGNGGGQRSAAWCFYGGAFRRSSCWHVCAREDCPGTFSRSMLCDKIPPERHLRLKLRWRFVGRGELGGRRKKKEGKKMGSLRRWKFFLCRSARWGQGPGRARTGADIDREGSRVFCRELCGPTKSWRLISTKRLSQSINITFIHSESPRLGNFRKLQLSQELLFSALCRHPTSSIPFFLTTASHKRSYHVWPFRYRC